jgi:hypothetical protein
MLATFMEFKRKKNNMRQFDNLGTPCQNAILTDCVALAKAYEAEENTGDDIELLACDFGQLYMLNVADFGAININNVVAWLGPRPSKPPRIE